MASDAVGAPLERISAREADVLAAVAEHLTNAEIAARLFISVRTVESHVSSMLRKLGAPDRRALVGLAAELLSGAETGPAAAASATVVARSPLTSFVGREAERAELATALAESRLVTAVGPGGVGKTRLAQVVAADVHDDRADGAWYVDLVPVTDPDMVAAAVSDALGLGQQRSRAPEDTLIGWLKGRDVLLVLDNCEHVIEGVSVLLERLLGTCPQLRVLATSRARLLVPYERVFHVPGLSVEVEPGGRPGGDAVELFVARAEAAGRTPRPDERERVAAVCRGLDGMSLAIELAASRFPTLGLDGLERGLADRLDLLVGGRRIDDRHRSLRSALDWSWALLDDVDRATLRRVSVFVRPFRAADAAAVCADWPPLASGGLDARLAALADSSLLIASRTDDGTQFQALETIRQYSSERLAEADERDAVRLRHARWCLAGGERLIAAVAPESGQWRADFDVLADELRAAAGWAGGTDHQDEAYRLGMCLGALTFLRGLPGESQRRYEHAARAAATPGAAAEALRMAAGAAETRHFGDEALHLFRASAEAAREAGEPARAAESIARIAELVNRGSGLITDLPTPDDVVALIAEAAVLAAGEPVAEARVAVAEAYRADLDDDRALTLARAAGSTLAECAAADQLLAVWLSRGEVQQADALTRTRVALLEQLPIRADCGLELSDGFNMATDVAVGAGDLAAARRFAERVRALPFQREEPHLACARLLVVTALTGDWDETVTLADQYRDGWERAGRPHDGDLNRGAYAAATVFGLRGDESARGVWLEIVDELVSEGLAGRDQRCYQTFDAILELHRGDPHGALRVMTAQPEDNSSWWDGLWRQWYAALWAEAAVLSDLPDRLERVARAGALATGNPVAAALVRRAAALAADDPVAVLAAGDDLSAAGCRYQYDRSRLLAGVGPLA